MKKSILFLILSTLIMGCNNDSNAKKLVDNESQEVNSLVHSENSSEIYKLATTYVSLKLEYEKLKNYYFADIGVRDFEDLLIWHLN